jgi:hypothetical protein
MMGGAKSSTAPSAVSRASSRKTVAGTIAEAAAIARRAAEDGQSAPVAMAGATPSANERDGGSPLPRHSEERVSERQALTEGSAPSDPVLLRRTRAGAGQLKDPVSEPDRTAAHLILAGRAYAYGRSIVHGDGGRKAGDSVAIES